MEDKKNNEKVFRDIKKSVDLLILIELCRLGASREQARSILGSLDNNLFSKINIIFGKDLKMPKTHDK